MMSKLCEPNCNDPKRRNDICSSCYWQFSNM